MARSRSLLIALLFVSTFSLGESPDWVEIRSNHFSVVTDAGEKRGRQVAERFEQMRFIFGALFLKDKVNIPVPLQIIAFRNSKEFRDFEPLWHGKPVRLSGLYQPGQDRNFILLDCSVEDPYPVVFHEYAHLLLNGNYPPTQLWFDEGFAEYYSTIKLKGAALEIGDPPEYAQGMLRGSRWMSVADLFSVGHDSAVYNKDDDHRSLFYAESWLVVHYLFDNKKLKETGDYFNLVKNQHTPVPEAIKTAFGTDAKQFDRALQSYFAGSAKAYGFTVPEMQYNDFRSQKLRSAEALAVLADAHLHSPDYLDKAISEFHQVLASDPQNEAAHRGLGYAALRKNDYTEARARFAKAAELDSKDPRVLYYSALLEQRESLRPGAAQPNLGEMRTQLEKSVAIDQDFADAYDLLAFVQAQQGSPAAAIQSEQQALRVQPREERYMLNYAQYLLAAHRRDEAKSVLSRLTSSDQPGVAATAQRELEDIDDDEPELSAAGAKVEIRPYPQKEWGTSSATSTKESADTAPERPAPNQASGTADVEVVVQPAKPDSRPISFLKGRLMSVDCSAAPAAVLTIAQGARVWKMRTADSKKLVLLGADDFSCSWKNQSVAVNYRASANGMADLVSLEIE